MSRFRSEWSINLEGEEPDWLEKPLAHDLTVAVPQPRRFTLSIDHHGEPVLVLHNATELTIRPQETEALGELLNDLGKLERLRAIVRSLAARSPNANAQDYCWLCDRWHVESDGHAHGCPWRRAVELLSTQGDDDGD